MPSRRDLIRMTPEEIDSYLRAQPRIILVTNGAEGLPHPVPMNFCLDDEGRILMTSFGKAQKVKNLERDPRAALLVESGGAYNELKSVLAYARAEILGDAKSIQDYFQRMAKSARGSGAPQTGLQQQVAETVAKRVVLRFTPFKYVSWDHGKLGGKY